MSFWPAELAKFFKPAGPRPCPYYFILGSCNSREPCRGCHEFAKEPTKAAIDALAAQIKARCDEVEKDPQLLKD